jgi:hypothetical protein
MTDPATIARNLSEAQRDVLRLFERPQCSRHVPQPYASALVAMGLLSGPGRHTHPSQRGTPDEYIITPFGLAVRDYLRNQTDE